MRPASQLTAFIQTSLLVMAIAPLLIGASLATAPLGIGGNTRPKVSFTFDDGLESTFTKALPILASHDMQATCYVDTFNMETPGRMSWAQINLLANLYGWEIGSHSETHPYLSQLSESEQDSELRNSRSQLAQHGLTATSFASPYGDYSVATLALIAKYYSSHRGLSDTGLNTWPPNDYLLTVREVKVTDSPSAIKKSVDEAIAKKRWLVLVFHDISDEPNPRPDYLQYATKDFKEIVKYVAAKNIAAPPVSRALAMGSTNHMPNPDFVDGLSRGWSTNAPHLIRPDSGSHGSSPEPQHAISIKAGDSDAYLFSPQVPVAYGRSYYVKSYLHVASIKDGEVGYYIDEYDRFGNWVNGQWKKAETSTFAEAISFWYKPSEPRVAQARLQIYVTPHSAIHAYVDTVQWLPL